MCLYKLLLPFLGRNTSPNVGNNVSICCYIGECEFNKYLRLIYSIEKHMWNVVVFFWEDNIFFIIFFSLAAAADDDGGGNYCHYLNVC